MKKLIYIYLGLIVASLWACDTTTTDNGEPPIKDSTQVQEVKKWTNDDFVITVKEAKNQPAPSLQSFYLAKSSQNEWLLIRMYIFVIFCKN